MDTGSSNRKQKTEYSGIHSERQRASGGQTNRAGEEYTEHDIIFWLQY